MGRSTWHGAIAAPIVVAVALVAHLWMFSAHDGAMVAHAEHQPAAASVVDTPLPAGTCALGMTACTATTTEEPRLPSAVLLSPLPVLLWLLRERFATTRPRPRRSDDRPHRLLSPVACGVLLLE